MADPTEQHYQSQSEKITQLPQIIALLRRLHEGRILLSVRIPGIERYFNSMLLNINTERKSLLLDEINNDWAHRKALEAGRLRVFAQCEGVEMNFHVTIRSARNKQGISFYQADLPEYMYYRQRRADYRVRVETDMEIPVFLPLEEERILDGQLCDVSMGGLGALVPNREDIHKGLIIPTCKIQLPQDPEPLQADLEICFILQDTNNQMLRLGGRFNKLAREDKSRLRRFVTQLEREMIRRRTRSRE